MKPIKLIWYEFNAQFSKSWIASISAFDAHYFVYYDHHDGKPKAINPKKITMEFKSIEEAKEYCQKEFEESVINLIQK